MPNPARTDAAAEAFSQRLQEAMTLAGIPAGRGRGIWLAGKYKVSPPTANAYLNGKHLPLPDKVWAMARDFGVEFAWLLFGLGVKRSGGGAATSQPARLDPTIIANATKALNVFLGRRDDRLDLEDPVDAETFAAAYDAIEAMRRDGGSDLELGAVVADLVKAREARKNAGRSEQAGGDSGKATGKHGPRKTA